jgi:hypothetical protein
MAPSIANLGTRRMGASVTLRQLDAPLHPWYLLGRMLGGTHSLSGCGHEEKNSVRDQTTVCSARSIIITLN